MAIHIPCVAVVANVTAAFGSVNINPGAISALVSDYELSKEKILPFAFDPAIGPAVAKAVAEAARKSGVARL